MDDKGEILLNDWSSSCLLSSSMSIVYTRPYSDPRTRYEPPSKRGDLACLVRSVCAIVTGWVPPSEDIADIDRFWSKRMEPSFWNKMMILADNLNYEELQVAIASI
jgi:hypothetical protein